MGILDMISNKRYFKVHACIFFLNNELHIIGNITYSLKGNAVRKEFGTSLFKSLKSVYVTQNGVHLTNRHGGIVWYQRWIFCAMGRLKNDPNSYHSVGLY